MKKSPIYILILILALAAGAIAQSGPPVAVLVDQLGSRALPLRSEVRPVAKIAVNVEVSATERRAFELMNAERQVAGLPMLVWSNDAAALARMHAESMATGKFFSHKGSGGETVDGRAAHLGIKWRAIGENIATMKGYDDPATKAVSTWMQSASHKQNILNSVYDQSAIGFAIASDGTVFFAQVFLSR